MGTGFSTRKIDAEEIENVFEHAHDKKQFKEYMDVAAGNGEVVQICQYLMSCDVDRSKDLAKVLNVKVYDGNTVIRKICKFCVKMHQAREYVQTILESMNSHTFLHYLLKNHYGDPFTEYVFDKTVFMNGKVLTDLIESDLTFGKWYKIVEMCDRNFDQHIAMAIVDMDKKLACRLHFVKLLFRPEHISAIRELDENYFIKCMKAATYLQLVKIQLGNPEFRYMPQELTIDPDGYERMCKFVKKYEYSLSDMGTIGFSNDYKKLGNSGKVELLRFLVWGDNVVNLGGGEYAHLFNPVNHWLFDFSLKNGVRINLLLHKLVESGQHEKAEKYLDYGDSITERDRDGKYAYEYASDHMGLSLYERLIPPRKATQKTSTDDVSVTIADKSIDYVDDTSCSCSE